MSVLQRTKRRFLIICLITCAVLMTVSWHLLYQSYETTIIKSMHLKKNNEATNLLKSSFRINISEMTNTYRQPSSVSYNILQFYNQNKNQNKNKNNMTKNNSENLSTMTQKEMNNILTKVTELLSDSELSFGVDKQNFIATLKNQLDRLHIDANINLSSQDASGGYRDAKTWQKYQHLTNNINKTLSDTHKIINNITATQNIREQLGHKKHSTSLKTSADTQADVQQHERSKLSLPMSQTGNSVNHVHHFSDISLNDLQSTWNDMQKNSNKIQESNKIKTIYQTDANIYAYQDFDNESGTYRPDYCLSCFSYEFPLIINQPQLCKSRGKVHLFIFISSAPGNREARIVIRKTWAAKCREPNSGFKCLFVVGRSKDKYENLNIQTENKTYGDVLQIDFKDSYGNLTYKTITSFRWTAKFCGKAKYVMKTDDDMYVNTELILQMLKSTPKTNFVGGYCWGSSNPNRDLTSKWFVSFKMYRKQKFPPMCSGTGYILSMDVIQKILVASHNVPFFHLEDVYVSLCLQKYGIMPNNILGFSNMYTEFDACQYRNSVMTSHEFPTKMLEDFWPMIQDCPAKYVSPEDIYIVVPYPYLDQ